jgi:hypothetical protein
MKVVIFDVLLQNSATIPQQLRAKIMQKMEQSANFRPNFSKQPGKEPTEMA